MTRQRPPCNFYTLLGVPSPTPSTLSSPKFDPAHKFVTSPLFRDPFVFGGLRLLTAFYTLTTLVVALAWNSAQLDAGESFFTYFTNLSYVGVTAYLFAAAAQTLAYAVRWRKNGAGVGFPLQRSWPRPLQALHVLLYASVVTFPFIVTIVYWSLLASSKTFETVFNTWTAISVHILNSVFALGEILLTNSPPPPWIALPVTIVLLGMYLGVAYVTHITQGFYTYSFLSPEKNGAKVAAYVFGIAVAQCVVFSIVHLLARLRQSAAVRSRRVLSEEDGPFQRDSGEGRGNRDEGASSDDEDWEEIEHPTSAASAGGKKSKESQGTTAMIETAAGGGGIGSNSGC